MKKLNNTEADLKKSVAYIKKRVVNATIDVKSRKLYVKPEYFWHHKNICLLQNEKKDLSFAIFKHILSLD